MPAERPEERAWAFQETLLEVLRRLNQSAERAGDVEGLEFVEIERALHHFWAVEAGENDLPHAVRLLTENGLIRAEESPQYAWDRRRVVGERYLITSLGKAYLARSVTETERIR